MGNGNWHINFSNKKINTFDEEASEVLADMLSCNYSLTELEINMCVHPPVDFEKVKESEIIHLVWVLSLYLFCKKKKNKRIIFFMILFRNIKRTRGNDFFQRKDYERALNAYTKYVCGCSTLQLHINFMVSFL